MKPLHGVTDKRLVNGGATYDLHENFVALSQKGEYIDAHNMRHPIDGNGDALEKINGEEIVYDNVLNACFYTAPYTLLSDTYVCIGAAHFFDQENNLDRTIEFWVDNPVPPNTALPPFIRIDGIVVAQSADIPFTYPNFLQLDVNNNCVGGEIYITDKVAPPMIFNFKDLMLNGGMIDSTCTQKYFADFNINLYKLELVGSNNHPVFIQLTNSPPPNSITIGASGMRVGQYEYQIRMVTALRDRSGWSASTPLIPMPVRQNSDGTAYPYNKTFGADVQVFSQFGIHLRYRVDNRSNYEFLEIKRIRHTIGAGLDIMGEEFLLDFRIPITPNQLQVIDLYDAGASELPLTDDDKDENFSVIDRVKSLRYYNQRLHLMNIKYQSRDVQPTILEINGKKMFPIMENIGQAGHKDPYHHVYHRSLMHGEKYGNGILYRDANNQKSFAQRMGSNSTSTEDYDNYEMPNRRVPCSAETIQYSTPVTAADVNGQINPTHEVFDLNNAVNKTAQPVMNISRALDSSNYHPFHPVSQGDSDDGDFNTNPNPQVVTGSSIVAYHPKGFGLNYFSLGMGLAGIDNIPKYIKSFTVVRTKPAGRVYCQGLGYYHLQSSSVNFPLSGYTPSTIEGALTKKIKNKFWFYSPDGDPDIGIVDMDAVISDAQANAGRFKAQLVSPLGFFTEVYSSHGIASNYSFLGAPLVQNLRSVGVDMINYVRVLNESLDLGVTSINVGDVIDAASGGANGVGISDGGGANRKGYVGYGKWRRRNLPSGAEHFANASGGETVFDITSVARKEYTIENLRSKYYLLELAQDFYNFEPLDNLNQGNLFNDPAVRNWHEPMYIVNVIDSLVNVPLTNISDYIETGHYQKTEATIAITSGVSELILLVDERREDVFQTALEDKVIFLIYPDGTEHAWQDISNFTTPQKAAIMANINTLPTSTQTAVFNGVTYTIDGAYTRSQNTIGSYTEYSVRFSNVTTNLPPLGSQVIVKYNTAEPIKVFGGDVTTHESVWCPIDVTTDSSGDPVNHQHLAAPYPYGQFTLYNRRVFEAVTPNEDTIPYSTFGEVTSASTISIRASTSFIRQMVVMFTCQSRINLPFEFEINQADTASMQKYFPATHYIMRPADWAAANTTPTLAQGNFMFPQYDVDYPMEAETYWGYGGFRFSPQTNIDYGKQDLNHTIVSKPKVGFVEETEFCTRDVWSVIRPINAIDSPGVRTFPAINFFDISDDTGEIKYAYDDDVQDRGNNLYAITESGICLLITDKTLLFDKTGNELAAIGSSDSAVVRDQIFISKTIGMSDEMWRGSAEGFSVMENNIRKQALFFFNKNSVYKLSQGQIADIARDGNYHSRVYPVIAQMGKGFTDNVTGVYDTLNDEFYLQIQLTGNASQVFTWEEKKQRFNGTYAYGFDKYLSFNNKVFGMRKARTYELNKGLVINGADITGWIVDATTNKLQASEYYWIAVNSDTKPVRVEFYNDKAQYLAGQIQGLIDTNTVPLSLKDYYAWSGYVPRKNIGTNQRMEGTVMVFRIIHNKSESFIINSLDLQSKLLK